MTAVCVAEPEQKPFAVKHVQSAAGNVTVPLTEKPELETQGGCNDRRKHTQTATDRRRNQRGPGKNQRELPADVSETEITAKIDELNAEWTRLVNVKKGQSVERLPRPCTSFG